MDGETEGQWGQITYLEPQTSYVTESMLLTSIPQPLKKVFYSHTLPLFDDLENILLSYTIILHLSFSSFN